MTVINLERLAALANRERESCALNFPVQGRVREAAQDAQQGNLEAAGSKLRRVSQRALAAANDLALAVAGTVIAHATGLA